MINCKCLPNLLRIYIAHMHEINSKKTVNSVLVILFTNCVIIGPEFQSEFSIPC